MAESARVRSLRCAGPPVTLLAVLGGCGGGDAGPISVGEANGLVSYKVRLSDFVREVNGEAGLGAAECGVIAPGGSGIEVESCLGRAFANDTDAWAIARYRDEDAAIASGTAVQDGEVTFYRFDRFPFEDSAADDGTISATECAGASLSGTVDPGAPVFDCEELVEDSSPLAGTAWMWTSYQPVFEEGSDRPVSIPIEVPTDYTLEFGTDGFVTGDALCNSFTGRYDHFGRRPSRSRGLRIVELHVTADDCDEGDSETADIYLRVLASSIGYDVGLVGDGLLSTGTRAPEFLRFAPVP